MREKYEENKLSSYVKFLKTGEEEEEKVEPTISLLWDRSVKFFQWGLHNLSMEVPSIAKPHKDHCRNGKNDKRTNNHHGSGDGFCITKPNNAAHL